MSQITVWAAIFAVTVLAAGCTEQPQNDDITVLEYLNSGFDAKYEQLFFSWRDTDRDRPPRIEILLKFLKLLEYDLELNMYGYSSPDGNDTIIIKENIDGHWRDRFVMIRSDREPSVIPIPQGDPAYRIDLNGRVIAQNAPDLHVKFYDGTLHRWPAFDETGTFFTVTMQHEPYAINLYKVSDPNTIIGRFKVPPFREIFRDKERLYLISSGSFETKAASCEIVDVSGDQGRTVEIIEIPFPRVWAASGLAPCDVDGENQLILFHLSHHNYITSEPDYIFDLKTRKLTKCTNGRNSDGIFLRRDFFDCLFKTLNLPNKKLSEINCDGSK